MPIAFITGASSGLGEVFARKLASRGYQLILVARREDRLRALSGQLGGNHRILKADLTMPEGIATAEQCIRTTEGLSLLVNNAGFGSKGRFWETEFRAQDDMHTLHVRATLHLTRAALEGMVARRSGAIINVSSVAGFMQGAGNVSYCATKAWMNSFTEGLAIELSDIASPVKVQALCPGYTHTEFHDVLQIDRSRIPRALWLNADFVVEKSLRGLERGSVYVVPGWRYRFITSLVTRLPAQIRMRLGRPGKDERV